MDTSSPGFQVVVSPSNPALRSRRGAGRKSSVVGSVLADALDVTERISELRFEDSQKELDSLRLTVDNHDLLFFDNPAWVKGNIVVFQFGYPQRLFGPRTAVVDSCRGFSTLKIECIVQAQLDNAARCRTFKNVYRHEVVAKIVKGGEIPGVTSLDISVTDIGAEKRRDWTQAGQNNLQFLYYLAEDVGYEVFVEGKVLHFHPKGYEKKPRRRYVWFHGRGDLLSFEITSMKTNDRPAVVEAHGRDPVERQNLMGVGSDSTTKRKTLGPESTQKIVVNRLDGTFDVQDETSGRLSGKKVVTTPERDPATVKSLADTHFKRSEEIEVQAKAKIVGDPEVAADINVEIAGISDLLSGNYHVEKAVHVIGGSYTTTLTLHRNAVGKIATTEPTSNDPAKAEENSEKAVANTRERAIVIDPVTGRFRTSRKE